MDGNVASMVKQRLVLGLTATVMVMFVSCAMIFVFLNMLEPFFTGQPGDTQHAVAMDASGLPDAAVSGIAAHFHKAKSLILVSSTAGILLVILIWLLIIREISTLLTRETPGGRTYGR